MNALATPRLVFAIAPALVISVLFVIMMWGEEGLHTRGQLREQLVEERQHLAELDRENQRLLRQIKLMERDPVVLERLVAEQLQLAAEGAVLYAFDDQP